MKKRFTFLIAALAAILMMAQPKMVVGQTRSTKTLQLSSTAKFGTTSPSSLTQSSVTWTCTATGSGSIQNTYDGSTYKGQQFGTASAKWAGTFSTSDITGSITSVSVRANTGGSANISVTVGGTSFKNGNNTTVTITKNTSNYTTTDFTGNASGQIIVTTADAATTNTGVKAFYLNSIQVTYSSGYTVTYQPGEGATGSNVVDNNVSGSYTVRANDGQNGNPNFSKAGHYFNGWNNGTSNVAVGEEIDVTAAVILTAQWQAYTITAQSNNNSFGTVELNGFVITATPASGYRYATPAYTVSPDNSATVEQNGNDFTVTPTANTTITINFEAIPCFTVTLSDDPESPMTEYSPGVGVTLPERPAIGSYDFAGWSETNVSDETTTAPTIIPAGTYYPTANITLYPVYTRTEEGGSTNANASVTIGDYASANNWENAVAYQPLVMDTYVSVGGTISGNNFKYYTSDQSWRFYSGGSFTITTTAEVLVSVTLTFAEGALSYNNTSITSATAFNVSGTSATVSASATTKITAISVTYTVTGSSTTYYWSSPVAAAVETPVITVAENPFYISTTATITCATEGADIKYSYDGENWNNYSTELTITAATTLYAKAIKDENESSVAQVTITKNLAEPTVTINTTGITNYNVFNGTAAGSLSASVTYEDTPIVGAAVTWSGNNNAVATINASTGDVTLVAAGSVTFTATYAGNGDYSEKAATYELTVINDDPNALTVWTEDFSGYSENAVPSGGIYSYACVDGGSDTKIYVQNLAGGTSPELLVGKNTGSFTATIPLDKYAGNLKLTYMTNAKSMTISTTTTGLSISGAATHSTSGTHEVVFTGITAATTSITIVFTAAGSDNVRLDNIELKGSMAAPQFSIPEGSITAGSTVTLSATEGATIYYTLDGSTPTTSSTVYSEPITISEDKTIKAIAVKNGKSSAVGTATYTIATDPFITVSTTSIAAGTAVTDGTITVTYNNLTDYEAEIYWYESDGETAATYDWLDAGINSTTKNIDYTIAENETYSSRTAYMKVYALGDEGEAESELITITQAGKAIDYAELPFTWDNTTPPTGVTLSTGGYYGSSPFLKLSNDSENSVVLKLNEAPGAIVFDIKGNPSSGSASTGTFKVMISDNGSDYTTLATYTSISNTIQTKSFTDISGDTRYIKWSYNKTSGNVALGNFIITKAIDIDSGTTTWTAGEFTPQANTTYIVDNGAILTLEGDFSASLSDPTKLIIEDGGILITHNAVEATVQKNITGVGAENWEEVSGAAGWYFIASPVNGADFNTATTGDYDLYLLDWADNWWRNIKKQENASIFAAGFQRGTGYLYASKDGNTISVAGEIKPLTAADTAQVRLKTTGWNLIGNPLTCKVTVDCPFDELTNASAVITKEAGNIINPCQGIAVWGNVGTTVTFTKAESQNAAAPSNNSIQMTLTQNIVNRGSTNSTMVDNAIISFNKSNGLPKFPMLEGNAKLYIPVNHEQYAIVSCETQGEMPVCFKAVTDGQYTISVKPEGVEVSYLHLIDNIAGTDIDLLATPSYTFNAKGDDYESRFRLVFSTTMVNAEMGEDFAFISDGQLVIANEGEATLQVIDVTGRVVATENINGTCSKAISAKAGVYVLRLVNGTEVKTQKMVIR